MNAPRLPIAGLAVMTAIMGLYLLYNPEISIMPDLDKHIIKVDLAFGDVSRDQIFDDLLIPVENEILHLNNVASVESSVGHQRGTIWVQKENPDSGASLLPELKEILNRTDVSYVIEPLTTALRPVFDYMVCSSKFPKTINRAAEQFKQDLEKISGIRRIEINKCMEDLQGVAAFKRYNGLPAVALSVVAQKDGNIRKTMYECEKLKKQYENRYGLEIASVKNVYEKAEHRVGTLHAFILITAVVAAVTGSLVMGSRALFAVLSALFCYGLSILMLSVAGISLNMVSVIGLLLFAGYGLANAVVAVAYTKKTGSDKTAAVVRPLILSAAGYGILFSSGLFFTGIAGRFITALCLSSVFMILVSLVFCSFVNRFAPAGTTKDSWLLNSLEKFWYMLLHNNVAAIFVVFVAVVMTVIPIIKWNAVKYLSFFPKSDLSGLYVIIDAGEKSEVMTVLSRIENQLSAMPQVERFITDYGVIHPYYSLAGRKSAENVAQIVADLKPGSDYNKVRTMVESQSFQEGVHIDVFLPGSSPSPRFPFRCCIYGNTYDALVKCSKAYLDELERIDGISNVHSAMEADGINRRDSRFYNEVGADMDRSIITKSGVAEKMALLEFPGPACEVSYNAPLKKTRRSSPQSGFKKMLGVSLPGLFFVFAVIVVAYRSSLGLLIPLSVLFIFAGIVNFKNQVSLADLLSLFGLQSIWTVKLLMFLEDFNLNKNTDLSTRIVTGMKTSFNSALMIYIPLATGFIYLWACGDFFMKAIAVSFIGGLIYIACFDLVFLPVVKKAEHIFFQGE